MEWGRNACIMADAQAIRQRSTRITHMRQSNIGLLILLFTASFASASEQPTLLLDFADERTAKSDDLLFHRVKAIPGKPLELTDALQSVELSGEAMRKLSQQLHGAKAMTIGGWFYPRRSGEQ